MIEGTSGPMAEPRLQQFTDSLKTFQYSVKRHLLISGGKLRRYCS